MQITAGSSLCVDFFISAALLLGLVESSNVIREKLNGYHLRVATYQFPPFWTTIKRPGGNQTHAGLGFELMETIAEFFNATIQFVPVDLTKVKDMSLTIGLFQQLDEYEVDVSPFFFELVSETLEHSALGYPAWITQYFLLQPWPEERSRLIATIRPFELPVWLCFLASTTVFITLMSALTEWENWANNERSSTMFRDGIICSRSFSELYYVQLEYVLTIITSQGNYIKYSTMLPIRVLLFCWLLCMVVLVNAYTGVLTAIMTVPLFEPIVNSMGEYAKSPTHKMIVVQNTLLANQILTATEGTYKAIGDSIRRHPNLIVKNTPSALESVAQHGFIFPGPAPLVALFTNEDVKTSGKCRFTIAPEPISFSITYQIGIAKQFTHNDALNYISVRLWDNGLVLHLMNKYLPSRVKCRIDVPPKTKSKSIALTELTGAFFILGIGISLSMVAFFIETLYYNIMN